ncbi:MAG: hypothetical protein KF784_09410 [Fimbriimonadaceae bacterium]|nr:hypothetical protein [Fimbriimonadaceae bacterium]
MKSRNILLSLAVVGALAATSSGQIAKSGSGYLFRLKYKPGQTIGYNMTTEARYGGPAGESVKVVFGMQVAAKTANKGQYGVVFTIFPATVVQDGKKQTTGEKAVVNATVDSVNRIVKSDAPEGAAPDIMDLTFPDKPIKPGFTWETASVGNMMKLGTLTAKTKYTFVGIKTVNGVSVAEIATTLTGTQQSAVLSGQGTLLLRTADGTYESNYMRITARPPGAPVGSKSSIETVMHLSRKKGS